MQISKKTEVLMYLLMCPVNFTNSPPFHVWAPPRSLQDIRKGRVCPPRVVHRSHYTLEKVWRHLKLKLRWGPFLKDMFCCRKRLWCLKICRYMLGPKVFYTHFNTPKMYHFQVEIHWRWEWTSIDYVYIYINDAAIISLMVSFLNCNHEIPLVFFAESIQQIQRATTPSSSSHLCPGSRDRQAQTSWPKAGGFSVMSVSGFRSFSFQVTKMGTMQRWSFTMCGLFSPPEVFRGSIGHMSFPTTLGAFFWWRNKTK